MKFQEDSLPHIGADAVGMIFDNIAIGICISRRLPVESDAEIVYASPYLAEIFNAGTQKKFIGMRLGEVLSEPLPQRRAHIVSLGHRRYCIPYDLETSSFSGRTIDLKIQHFLSSDNSLFTVCQDMTQARMAERLLHEKTLALHHVLSDVLAEKEAIANNILEHLETHCLPIHEKMEPRLSSDTLSDHYRCCLSQMAALKLYTRKKTSIDYQLEALTATERKVFQDLGEGKTAEAIAADRHVSARTIETHTRNIRLKLGLVHRKITIADYYKILEDHLKNTASCVY